jgi:hypothetical protein
MRSHPRCRHSALASLILMVGGLGASPTQAADLYEAGDWALQLYASHAYADDDPGEYTALRFGFSHYVARSIAFQVEAIVATADAQTYDETPGGAGPMFGIGGLLRWTFKQGDGWAVHAEGGTSFVRFDDPFPSVATRSNFESQGGIGVSFRIRQNVHGICGARYVHVSNASQFGATRNPGFDAIQPYFGLTWLLR